jgi:anti-sigma28 factor (negative regulator of flagellin synthesis)
MAGKGATLSLKITGDASGARDALDDVEGKAGRMDGVFGKMGAGIAAGAAIGVAAIAGLGKASFDAASELQQSTGAIDAVFGDWALDIEQAAQSASTSVGLSTSQYENMAAVIGAQLHNAGMAHDEMKDKTTALIATGADMAAIFGGTAADAVDALSSALKGEMDPIERYGVSLNQNAIQTQMAADGTDKLTGAAQKQAQTNAILELITKQTADTQGQWAAQSGTAAEAQQILGAKVENLKAKIGEGLLPIFASAASWISDKVLPAFDDLTASGGPLSDMMAQVGAFIRDKVLPVAQDLTAAFRDKLVPIFKIVADFVRDNFVPVLSTLWSFVSDYLVPIIKTVMAPALEGVRDVFQKLSDKVNDNRDKFSGLYEKLKPFLDFLRDQVAPFVGGVLKLAFEGLGLVIGPVIDAITWILDKAASVVGFVGKIGGAIGGLFGAGTEGGGAPRAAGHPLVGAAAGAAPLRTATYSGGAGTGPTGAAGLTPVLGGGDTFNITISGVLDADDAADQIARLLERRDRFTGRALAAAL